MSKLSLVLLFLFVVNTFGAEAITKTFSVGNATVKCFNRSGANVELKLCADKYLTGIERSLESQEIRIQRSTLEYYNFSRKDVFVDYQLKEASRVWSEFIVQICEFSNAYLHQSTNFGVEVLLCEAHLNAEYANRLRKLSDCQLKRVNSREPVTCKLLEKMGERSLDMSKMEESVVRFLSEAFPYHISPEVVREYRNSFELSRSSFSQHILNYCVMSSFYISNGDQEFEKNCIGYFNRQLSYLYSRVFKFKNFELTD